MAELRERMHWSEVGLAARTLAERILDDGYRPDMLLSIARGGLVVGGALAYALDVKNTFTMNVEFYVGVEERLPMPMILPPVPELVDLDEARVLIVDDVADTGQTLALVKDFCAGSVGEASPCVERTRQNFGPALRETTCRPLLVSWAAVGTSFVRKSGVEETCNS